MAANNVNLNHNLGHSSKESMTACLNKVGDQSNTMDLEQLQHMINCTVKKNPKTELSKSDLLRLLGYLEGELQARDVVIATLKADRVKHLVNHARYGRLLPVNDPYVALQRDNRAAMSTGATSDDAALLKAVTEGPMTALEAMVVQHRKSHMNLIQAMQDAETRHSKVLRELEDEKRKHEHDTAQGDDITYGLEKERTRLREELEIERQGKKKLEKEMKKMQETLEEEKQRQKQIVLLLLAERKKLILKYVEERNRSEDLAQILGEEKSRVDTMAEGLEEESQKALQMESDLEKNLALFDSEKSQLKAQLQREEKRAKDLELIAEKLQTEVDNLKKQQAEAHQVAMFQAGLNQSGPNVSPPHLPSKPSVVPPQTPPRTSVSSNSISPMNAVRASVLPAGSVPVTSATGLVILGTTGKVVQPTSMVTSTPVPAPTTGIARAVSPAGSIRNVHYSLTQGSSRTLPPSSANIVTSTNEIVDTTTIGRMQSASSSTTSRPSSSASASSVGAGGGSGSKVFTTTNKEGKVTFHVAPTVTTPQPTTPKKVTSSLGRGVPPPVPPNKPIIPPKKSNSISGPMPFPMAVISSSNHPQVTNVDSARPMSAEVQPVKFGIISKEKILQSNSSSSNLSSTVTETSTDAATIQVPTL